MELTKNSSNDLSVKLNEMMKWTDEKADAFERESAQGMMKALVGLALCHVRNKRLNRPVSLPSMDAMFQAIVNGTLLPEIVHKLKPSNFKEYRAWSLQDQLICIEDREVPVLEWNTETGEISKKSPDEGINPETGNLNFSMRKFSDLKGVVRQTVVTKDGILSLTKQIDQVKNLMYERCKVPELKDTGEIKYVPGGIEIRGAFLSNEMMAKALAKGVARQK